MDFCKFAIQHEAFVSGKFDTHFVQNYFTPDVLETEDVEGEKIAAIIAAKVYSEAQHNETEMIASDNSSNWKRNRLNNR